MRMLMGSYFLASFQWPYCENNLIDLFVQKGCMSKVPGCREHMSLIWKELKTSKANNKLGLAAACLEIANAFGFNPDKLTFFVLTAVWYRPKIGWSFKVLLWWPLEQILFTHNSIYVVSIFERSFYRLHSFN